MLHPGALQGSEGCRCQVQPPTHASRPWCNAFSSIFHIRKHAQKETGMWRPPMSSNGMRQSCNSMKECLRGSASWTQDKIPKGAVDIVDGSIAHGVKALHLDNILCLEQATNLNCVMLLHQGQAQSCQALRCQTRRPWRVGAASRN